jgi:hypothetical protein
MAESRIPQLKDWLTHIIRDAFITTGVLLKITIPVSIITKLLKDLGATDQLGVLLSPLMGLLGLPGSMGLVWATAMLTNLYTAMIVFASLAPEAHLTVAQVTVLCTMMLVAHGLPVELGIARSAGPRIRAMAAVRVGGAILIGGSLNQIYLIGGFLQQPNQALWNPPPQETAWLAWSLGELRNIVWIFLIILALLVVMRTLKAIGVMDLLTRILEPALTFLGIRREAAPVTIIGMMLGLSYGGGLIIQEARSGQLQNRDIYFSLALMGLSHSLVEDTLLMMVLGGDLSGILFGRVFFSLLIMFIMVKLMKNCPEQVFNRYFFRKRHVVVVPDELRPSGQGGV